MEIRRIKKSDDIKAIGKIYEKSWKFAYNGIIPKDYLDSISGDKWLPHFENKNMNSLVLIENNQFIGTSSYCKSRSKEFRQNRVYRDKKEKSEQEVSKKQKRQVNPCFFYSKQAVIRPRGQNAYQRDRGLQEQTKNSI